MGKCSGRTEGLGGAIRGRILDMTANHQLMVTRAWSGFDDGNEEHPEGRDERFQISAVAAEAG
jgi:hypothetical protein